MPSLGHLLCASALERNAIKTGPDNLTSTMHRVIPSPMKSDNNSRGNPRRCGVPDCQKTAKRGGRCIAHGGGNKCSVEGCTTSVVSRGLCVAHGGGKRCQTADCTKSAQSGGFCWVHGGGKKCGYLGCPKRAQSGGACIAHGGGKRCRIQGCNKVVQYDGLCVGHGGYRRCAFANCERRAMANDYCQQHGGSSICLVDQCYKRAVRGGMCSEHKAEATLHAATASGLKSSSHSSRSSDDGSDRGEIKRETLALIDTRRVPEPRWKTREFRTKTRSPMMSEPQQLPLFDCPVPIKPAPPIPRFVHRGQSPTSPGLLIAGDTLPAFSVVAEKIESAGRYDNHHHEHRQLGHSSYPVLPRIQALQSYCNRISPSSKLQDTQFDSASPASAAPTSELRIVVKEDARSCKLATEVSSDRYDTRKLMEEPSARKFYVHSYYYRQSEGTFACSS